MSNTNISLLHHNFLVCSGGWLWAHNSQELASPWAGVQNLCLKWNFLQLFYIDFHEFKIFLASQLILKWNFSISSCISKLFLQNSSILKHMRTVFISEGHSLMKLNNHINIKTDNLILKDVSEIISQFFRVNNFHVAVSEFCQSTNNFHFAALSLNCHDVDWKISCFGQLSEIIVQLFVLFS